MKTSTKFAADPKKWIGYYRVSTQKQSLGLEAQRSKVEAAAKEAGAEIIAWEWEKESGRDNDRPKLKKAMALARRHRAVVVVAKHDRLSRVMSTASKLVFESDVTFLCLNVPAQSMENQIVFGVFFGMAAEEAALISKRTSDALQALKEQGKKLGCPAAVEMQIWKDHYTEQAKVLFPDDEKKVEAEVKRLCSENVDYQELALICCPKAWRESAYKANREKAQKNPNNIESLNEIKNYIGSHEDYKLQDIADYLTAKECLTSRGVFHTAKSVDLLCKREGIELSIKRKTRRQRV